MSTLDGLVAVEGDLVEMSKPDLPFALPVAAFEFTNLGASTSVRLEEDDSIHLQSTPQTDSLKVNGTVVIKEMPPKPLQWDNSGFSLRGHYGLKRSSVDNVAVEVSKLRDLTISPGRKIFDIDKVPEMVGWLYPGFRGDFEKVELGLDGVRINPDIEATLKFRSIWEQTFTIPAISTAFHFHRYDKRCRPTSSGVYPTAAFHSVARVAGDAVPDTRGKVPLGTRVAASSGKGGLTLWFT